MAKQSAVSLKVQAIFLTSSSHCPVDVQEIFGSHYELPELGPLGASGLANVRDFEYPVAHFDIEQTAWEGKVDFGCVKGETDD